MMNNTNIIRMRQLVENSIPRKIKTPSDFTYLLASYMKDAEKLSQKVL